MCASLCRVYTVPQNMYWKITLAFPPKGHDSKDISTPPPCLHCCFYSNKQLSNDKSSSGNGRFASCTHRLAFKTVFWRFPYSGKYDILSTIYPDFKRVQSVFREPAACAFLH